MASSHDEDRLDSVGPTHPVRASMLWASSWVSWGNIPHSSLVRFTVELQHIFVEVLDQVNAEHLGFVPLFVSELFM